MVDLLDGTSLQGGDICVVGAALAMCIHKQLETALFNYRGKWRLVGWYTGHEGCGVDTTDRTRRGVVSRFCLIFGNELIITKTKKISLS